MLDNLFWNGTFFNYIFKKCVLRLPRFLLSNITFSLKTIQCDVCINRGNQEGALYVNFHTDYLDLDASSWSTGWVCTWRREQIIYPSDENVWFSAMRHCLLTSGDFCSVWKGCVHRNFVPVSGPGARSARKVWETLMSHPERETKLTWTHLNLKRTVNLLD